MVCIFLFVLSMLHNLVSAILLTLLRRQTTSCGFASITVNLGVSLLGLSSEMGFSEMGFREMGNRPGRGSFSAAVDIGEG